MTSFVLAPVRAAGKLPSIPQSPPRMWPQPYQVICECLCSTCKTLVTHLLTSPQHLDASLQRLRAETCRWTSSDESSCPNLPCVSFRVGTLDTQFPDVLYRRSANSWLYGRKKHRQRQSADNQEATQHHVPVQTIDAQTDTLIIRCLRKRPPLTHS